MFGMSGLERCLASCLPACLADWLNAWPGWLPRRLAACMPARPPARLVCTERRCSKQEAISSHVFHRFGKVTRYARGPVKKRVLLSTW